MTPLPILLKKSYAAQLVDVKIIARSLWSFA